MHMPQAFVLFSEGTLLKPLTILLFLFACVAPAGATTTYYRVTDLGPLGGAPPLTSASVLDGYIPPGSGWILKEVTETFSTGHLIGWGQHDSTPRFFGLTPLKPGDANADGRVNGADLALWQQNYNPISGGATFFTGDWNGDGKVSGADLALWQQNYNPLTAASFPYSPEPLSYGAATHAPEPTTLLGLLMAAVAAGGLGFRRWKPRRA